MKKYPSFGHFLDQDPPLPKKIRKNSNQEGCRFASVHGNV